METIFCKIPLIKYHPHYKNPHIGVINISGVNCTITIESNNKFRIDYVENSLPIDNRILNALLKEYKEKLKTNGLSNVKLTVLDNVLTQIDYNSGLISGSSNNNCKCIGFCKYCDKLNCPYRKNDPIMLDM